MKNQPFRKLSERLAAAAPGLSKGDIRTSDLCDSGVASFLRGYLEAMWPYEDGVTLDEDESTTRGGDPTYILLLETRGGTIAYLEQGLHPGVLAAKGILFALGVVNTRTIVDQVDYRV